jgi:RimJ/RimL family protein N-acetyltransferase
LTIHPLRALLDNAAAGKFPPVDGLIEVVPSPGGLADAIIGMTGHFMLAADIDASEVAAHVAPGDFSAPMSSTTLHWLAQRLDSRAATFDVLLCHRGTGGGAPEWLREVDGHDHPRVERASRYRTDMRVFVADDDAAVLVVGRGVCDRWEFGFEVSPDAQGRGMGRHVAQAATGLVPAGEPLWGQIAPGNAASLRAVGAAGFVPVGAEVLFPRAGESRA